MELVNALNLGKQWSDAEYQGLECTGCEFTGCTFSSITLVESVFRDCRFTDCELRAVRLVRCSIANLEVNSSSLVGLDWSDLRRDGLLSELFTSVSRCTIKYNTFVDLKLPRTDFSGSAFFDSYFQNCDLSSCDFRGCDLEKTVFDDCNLSRADFRDARHYYIDVHKNRMAKARFSTPEVIALLGNLDIVID